MNIYASKSLGEKSENEVNKQATMPTRHKIACSNPLLGAAALDV